MSVGGSSIWLHLFGKAYINLADTVLVEPSVNEVSGTREWLVPSKVATIPPVCRTLRKTEECSFIERSVATDTEI